MENTEIKNSGRNKIYFRILSVVLVFLVFALVELLLRMFSVGSNVNLFVRVESASEVSSLQVNPQAGKKYFTRFEATSGTNDRFLKHKPDNGYRIFMLGSSTLVGYPYDFNLMASRILQERLQDAYPGQTIEVVNTAITAINSVTLKDYARQVMKYEPDAILIYAGHNEFYGAFGIGSRESIGRFPALISAHLKLMNLRIYQLIRSAIGTISRQLPVEQGSPEARGTLMKRIVKDEEILYHGEKYRKGIDRYRENMASILEMAGKHQVNVFISDLVSNIRDLRPFGTVDDPGSDPRRTYLMALNTLEQGDTLKARNMFYEAKDLDPIRFRASEEINEIIHELAEVYGATLIPVKARFSDASPGGLIGNNLLTEHVHPNIDGQFLLADAFYTVLTESGKLGAHPGPDGRTREYYRHHWGYTALDSLIGYYKIEFLKSYWPFTSLEQENLFRDTFQVSGVLDSLAFSILTDPSATFQSLHLELAEEDEAQGRWGMAFREYLALITIDPYHSRYYTQAASCKLKMNDLYAAEKFLTGSLKHGKDLLAFSLLGEVELIKHNFKHAADLFSEALQLAEKDPMEEVKRKALINDLTEKKSEAERLLRSPDPVPYTAYPQIVPHDIAPTYRRALSFVPSEPDSALYYFNLCLEINDCPLVNFQIGNLLYQKQERDVMLYYDKAYPGFGRDPDFLVRYCVASLMNNELSKAKEIYQLLTLLAPRHPDLAQLKQAIEQ